MLLFLQIHFDLRQIGAWCCYVCRSFCFFYILFLFLLFVLLLFIFCTKARTYFPCLWSFFHCCCSPLKFNCDVCRIGLNSDLRDVFHTQINANSGSNVAASLKITTRYSRQYRRHWIIFGVNELKRWWLLVLTLFFDNNMHNGIKNFSIISYF